MVRYHCEICNRDFATPGGLTQHANAKHHGRITLSQPNESVLQRSLQQLSKAVTRPEHDELLWNMPITITSPSTSQERQDNIDEMMDIVTLPQENEDLVDIARYNLRKRARSEEGVEEISEESEIDEIPVNLEAINLDLEDIQGAMLDDALDAIEGKYIPERVAKWPNDAYREFMELVVEGNISNKIGDKIIKFFNKHSNLEESPLPKSTRNGKDYINQINSPSLEFKEKIVATYSEVDFKLYYRPIFRAIQALLQRPKVAENFVHKGNLKKVVGISLISAIKWQ